MSEALPKPWLSVVIPSYHGERWITACLESIAAEVAGGIEVLLIDGGPTAQTVGLARRFSERLRLQIFERPDLSTWHAKTDFGIETARSEHMCWLGVDDVWLPGRAAAARAWINADPVAPLHLGPSAIIDAAGTTLGIWRCPLPASQPLAPRPLAPAEVISRLLVQNFIAAPAPIFRKDAWLACGGLDATLWYTADWDIWLRLAACGPVYYHDVVTIGFRIHDAALTTVGSRNATEYAAQMLTVLERHLPALRAPLLASQALPPPRESRRALRLINRTERVARASIAVNSALAAAATHDLRPIGPAVLQLLQLGPLGLVSYVHNSRIVDRLLPRLRARLSGRL